MGLHRGCLREQIRRALARRIVDGTYQPGHRLVELQIAEEFNTSQGPVREALRELEAMRLVESETYRGTRVRSISDEELIETAEVRGVLEQEAALKAAGALKGGVTPLHVEFEAIRRAAVEDDFDAYAHHNMAFHRHIVEAAGNAALLRVWESLSLEVRARIAMSRRALNLKAIAESHLPIIEALDRGEGEAAGQLLRVHAVSFGWDEAPPRVEPAPAPRRPARAGEDR